MKTFDYTVIYIADSETCSYERSHIDRFKEIINPYECNYLAVPVYDHVDTQTLINQIYTLCRYSETISERLIFIGFGKGAYVASCVSRDLVEDLIPVSSVIMMSPPINDHDTEDTCRFDPPLCDRTIILHGYHNDRVHPSDVWDYCAEYNLPVHMINDGYSLEEGMPLACYVLDQEITRLKSGINMDVSGGHSNGTGRPKDMPSVTTDIASHKKETPQDHALPF